MISESFGTRCRHCENGIVVQILDCKIIPGPLEPDLFAETPTPSFIVRIVEVQICNNCGFVYGEDDRLAPMESFGQLSFATA